MAPEANRVCAKRSVVLSPHITTSTDAPRGPGDRGYGPSGNTITRPSRTTRSLYVTQVAFTGARQAPQTCERACTPASLVPPRDRDRQTTRSRDSRDGHRTAAQWFWRRTGAPLRIDRYLVAAIV